MNVIYPLASRISSECLKASSIVENLPPKITQILKITIKFKNEKFDDASESLQDLQHFYDGLRVFLMQFSNFLNDPPTTNPLNTLSLLIYNSQLMESATLQISSASKSFAGVFGENMRKSMEMILSKYSEVITVIRASMEIIQLNFESILDADTAVSIEMLEGELDSQALSDMITAFQEISIASKQMLLIITGISEITKSLDATTSALDESLENVKSSLSSMSFILNAEVQTAKIKFIDEIRGNIHSIVTASSDYSQFSLNIYANTTTQNFLDFIQSQEELIHDFTSHSSDLLSSIQDEFGKQLNIYYTIMHQVIRRSKNSIVEHGEKLRNYLATLIIEHSGSSFKNCFTNTTIGVQRQALDTMETMQLDFTSCAISERTLSNQVESLLTFIVEDITLNIQGAFDQACECLVKGGKRMQEVTKECIAKVCLIN